jgi:3-deoxy-D-manno-octulosonate 8-phosphate phosphatase (KDO 8-P phosphatase)
MNKRLVSRARRIRLAIFDVDGVLTDGALHLGKHGEQIKTFNILDGLGLKMLAASGVGLALLSGRKSSMVALRARETGIAHVLQGKTDKLEAYHGLLRKLKLAEEETSFMGICLTFRCCADAAWLSACRTRCRSSAATPTMSPRMRGAAERFAKPASS